MIHGNKLNCGSGQRPFAQRDGWVNIDINPKWKPDLVADCDNLSMFQDSTMSMIVSHHCIEHAPCGGADAFLKESYRLLKSGGSLIVTVPDLKALAQRWLAGGIDDYIYIVNLMGAYMDSEADRHKWHYTADSLEKAMAHAGFRFDHIKPFDFRRIEGADIAQDFWILGMEAIKE